MIEMINKLLNDRLDIYPIDYLQVKRTIRVQEYENNKKELSIHEIEIPKNSKIYHTNIQFTTEFLHQHGYTLFDLNDMLNWQIKVVKNEFEKILGTGILIFFDKLKFHPYQDLMYINFKACEDLKQLRTIKLMEFYE